MALANCLAARMLEDAAVAGERKLKWPRPLCGNMMRAMPIGCWAACEPASSRELPPPTETPPDLAQLAAVGERYGMQIQVPEST